MSLYLAIGGYLLSALWVFLGLRDAEGMKLLISVVWLAVAVKYTRKYRMDRYLKQLEEDQNGETHCSV